MEGKGKLMVKNDMAQVVEQCRKRRWWRDNHMNGSDDDDENDDDNGRHDDIHNIDSGGKTNVFLGFLKTKRVAATKKKKEKRTLQKNFDLAC